MLSEELFARVIEEQAASAQHGASMARRHGLLTVYGTLGSCFLLTRFGDVLVDRDDGRLWPADDEEREFAYVQAARRFPRLRHLMPERPEAARTCERCGGSGEIAFHDGRNVVCCPDCNTRGWTVAR